MTGFHHYPSMFDGDDAARGLVDRAGWLIVDGRLVRTPIPEETAA